MKKILICEDEYDASESMRNVLTKNNYEAFTAVDGLDAIKKTKEIKPDLILLDIRMPNLDGIDVARQIREFDTNVKIVFISGFQSNELFKEASKYNISNYIVKPTSTTDILKAVQVVFSAK